jgi:hypothetical protein
MSQHILCDGIFGLDGKSPIREVTNRMSIYAIGEIYQGVDAEGKYVPKAGDMVIDVINQKAFFVLSVSDAAIPKLQCWTPHPCADLSVDVSSLLPVVESNVFLFTVDKSVSPHRCLVDPRFFIGGTQPTHASVYVGRIATIEGKTPITYHVKEDGTINHLIPLELVGDERYQSVKLKVVPLAWTLEDFDTSEVVTIVVHDESGRVISAQPMRVVTSVLSDTHVPLRHITGIELSGGNVKTGTNNVITTAPGDSVESLDISCVLKYSNGSQSPPIQVGSGRASLLGVSDLVYLTPGTNSKAVIQIKLGQGEVGVSHMTQRSGYLTIAVKVMVATSGARTPIWLYPSLTWKGVMAGFSLKWWMVSGNSRIPVDVTPAVLVNAGDESTQFVGAEFNTTQTMTVVLNIRDINPLEKPRIHRQRSALRLLGNPMSDRPLWTSAANYSGDSDFTGSENRCKVLNLATSLFNLSNGCTTVEEWVLKFFRPIPLCTTLEDGTQQSDAWAIEPTHCDVMHRGNSRSIPISNVLKNIVFGGGCELGEAVTITFVRVTPDKQTSLSHATFTIV